jgi:hypothetical protein
MKTKKTIIAVMAVLAIFIPASVFSQVKTDKAKNAREFLAGCDSVWYYGLDVSHVRVTDKDKIPRSSTYEPVYPAAWIGYVEKELPPIQRIMPRLKVKAFTYVPEEVQKQTAFVAHGFIIGTDYSLPHDTLAAAVKGYKLARKRGVGLVIIAENFNKPHETSTSWIVLFDIRTRELLWTVKSSGGCHHMGYTAHWGSGIVNGFNNFLMSLR